MMRNNGRSILRVLAHHGVGILVALGVIGGVAPAQAATVKVRPDEAKLVRLSDKPATVVVGNPLYADVLVVGNKVLVQGHNYGKTNVIILNNEGEQIAQFDVVVAGQPQETISVYRRGVKETLFCAPECSDIAETTDNSDKLYDYAMRVRIREKLIKYSLQRGSSD